MTQALLAALVAATVNVVSWRALERRLGPSPLWRHGWLQGLVLAGRLGVIFAAAHLVWRRSHEAGWAALVIIVAAVAQLVAQSYFLLRKES